MTLRIRPTDNNYSVVVCGLHCISYKVEAQRVIFHMATTGPFSISEDMTNNFQNEDYQNQCNFGE